MPYDLSRVDIPRLAGRPLRLIARVLETPGLRALLLPRLLRAGGIDAFRRLRPHEPPTVQPFVPPGSRSSPEAVRPLRFDALADLSAPGQGFAFPSALDYARAYRAGRLDPREVARRVLAAIADSNRLSPPLRAVIRCEEADVRAQAEESARRLTGGRPRSVLEGVPVAVKDELDQVPYPTRLGTRFAGGTGASSDATVVARLRDAGALLIGKTNMFEIGIVPSGMNIHTGFARNPYAPDHDTGGSSSGSAAAVAAGFCPIAMGADGGGSIRIPAALCGVFGIKATYARISTFGAGPVCWSVAHVGPLGATALDIALAYAVTSGGDPRDSWTMRQPPPELDGVGSLDLTGQRLGVFDPWFEDAQPDVVRRGREMLRHFEKRGAVLVPVDIAGLDAMRTAHAVTILAEMASALEPYFAAHGRELAPAVRVNLAIGRRFDGVDYVRAQRLRTRAMAEFARVFEDVDAILTPTTACTAPPIRPEALAFGESDLATVTELMRFIVPANLCGLPAVSFPAGYDSAGLPVGMQAIGRWWEESRLLKLAFAAEAAAPRRRPNTFYELGL